MTTPGLDKRMHGQRGPGPIDAIFLDFDGVLVDSVPLKSHAFRDVVARRWPSHADEALEYFMRHGGVSRRRKFEHVLSRIIGNSPDAALLDDLCAEFSQRVFHLTVLAEPITGALSFLERFHRRIDLFVVSGTPQQELRHIVARRGQVRFFKGVFGSPDDKIAIGRRILERHHYDRRRVAFVGDATTDRDAAHALSIRFIGVDGPHLTPYLNGREVTIRDLSLLPAILKLTVS